MTGTGALITIEGVPEPSVRRLADTVCGERGGRADCGPCACARSWPPRTAGQPG